MAGVFVAGCATGALATFLLIAIAAVDLDSQRRARPQTREEWEVEREAMWL